MTSTLVLLRHGQSVWNAENLFTGWWDADLSDKGRTEAAAAGTLMAEAGIAPDKVHTSLQTRAIRTALLAVFGTAEGEPAATPPRPVRTRRLAAGQGA